MSAPLTVAECGGCGYRAYPPRILCPSCGGGEWKPRRAGAGVVTEITVRRPVYDEQPARLAAVRSDAGPRIVARASEGVEAGDRVALVNRDGVATAIPLRRLSTSG